MLNILSQLLSIVCYPLFVPTYGMLLYTLVMTQRIPTLPQSYVWVSILGTFALTALLPIIFICILWRKKKISSLHIDNPHERTMPYVYSIVCFAFWCYFLYHSVKMPLVWVLIAMGATTALGLVTIINRQWKISAHLTAMGGLLGGMCSISLYYGTVSFIAVALICLLSLLLMYARLYMKAHTPTQVVCGYILGILCTFIPNYVIYA